MTTPNPKDHEYETENLRKLIIAAQGQCNHAITPSRELSLVKTKLEEAELWLTRLPHPLDQQASAPAKGAEGDRQAEGHDAVGTGEAEAALIHDLEEAAEHAGQIEQFSSEGTGDGERQSE
jgi:hypothetical protein